MKPLAIDFAPHSLLRQVLLARPASWMLMALGVALCASAALAFFQARAQQSVLGAAARKVAASRHSPAGHAASLRPVVLPGGQVQAVNRAVTQLNTRWPELFAVIETATTGKIAMLQLEVDANTHVVRATAEARTRDDMLDYLQALRRTALLQQVTLVRHTVNEQDPQVPWRFQFEASWTEGQQ